MAGWGGGNQLPAGDYWLHVTDVKKTMGKDFKDPTKEKPQYQFSCDAFMPDGRWAPQTVWTAQSFTPPDQEATAEFISNLNRVVKAVGLPMPQSAEAAAVWDEKITVGRAFILRMEADPERPQKLIKRFLPITFPHRALMPPNAAQVMAQMGVTTAAQVPAAAPTAAPADLQAQIAALQAQQAASRVAGAADDYSQ